MRKKKLKRLLRRQSIEIRNNKEYLLRYRIKLSEVREVLKDKCRVTPGMVDAGTGRPNTIEVLSEDGSRVTIALIVMEG